MSNETWELGVPRTVGGVEYVAVRVSEEAYRSDRDIHALRVALGNPAASYCAGCPFRTPAIGERRCTAQCGAVKTQTIVPVSVVPILALEGVLA